jgi:DNA-binding LacI/PurR family transcriptional regulator
MWGECLQAQASLCVLLSRCALSEVRRIASCAKSLECYLPDKYLTAITRNVMMNMINRYIELKEKTQMAVTIRDVARRANVSVSAVSAVLNPRNNNIRVGKNTRHRILQICEELNYHPNAHARNLAQRSSDAVAFIVPPPANGEEQGFHMDMLSGIQEVINLRGLKLVLHIATKPFVEDKLYLRWFEEKSIGGMLFWATGEYEWFCALKDAGYSFVLIDDVLGDGHEYNEFCCVQMDHFGAARVAVEHLIKLEHKKIAHVRGRKIIGRDKGYQQALKNAGLTVYPHWVVDGDFTQLSGYQKTKELLETNQGFTAVFADNDYMAIGAIRAILEKGLRIPHDISVVGVDDIATASYVYPPLTTVRMSTGEAGRRAAGMLCDLLDGARPEDISNVVLPFELVVRKSSGYSYCSMC